MNLSFLVCHNGYGHLKRVTSVVNELLKSDCQVNLFIHPDHISAIEYFDLNKNSDRLTIHSEGMSYAPDWLNSDYNADKYSQWLEFLEKNETLAKSDQIISDNYVSPLATHPNTTILMGSFLWHDVLTESNKEIAGLLTQEKDLFRKQKPTMLCLKDFAMNEIDQYGQAVKFGFFTTESEAEKEIKTGSFHLLLTGGGTGRINDYLLELASQLEQEESCKVFVDNKLNKISQGKFPVFDYSDSAFKSLDAIIARPGIGILTEAAKFHVRLVLIPEDDNKELKHNAEVVVKKQMGIKLDLNTEAELAAKSIVSYLKSEDLQSSPSNVLAYNGHIEAANYILNSTN